MNPKMIAYWVTTGLLSFALFGAGAAKLMAAPQLVENLTRIGLPTYFMQILGPWEVLAPVALLAPKFPLVKEWAYAGAFFAMSGAFAAHVLAGDAIAEAVPSAGLAALTVASYLLRPASRRLPLGA